MTDSLAESADRNLAATWAALGRLTGGVDQIGNVHLYATGLSVPFFNGAVATGPSECPAATVTAIFDFMKGRSVPWVLWARPGVADELVAAGRAAGMDNRSGPPAMGMHPIPASPATPPELSIEVVNDVVGLDAHRRLASRAFELAEDLITGLVNEAVLRDGSFAILLGKVDGVPVSTSLLSMSGDTAGIYNVATPVEHQRRGYGAAVTWAAIREGVRRGATRSILQTSKAGRTVYEQMGYAHLGTYIQLEGPPG